MPFQEPNQEEIKIQRPDEWQIKIEGLPEKAQAWLTSLDAAKNNKEIAKKHGLPKEMNPILAEITGQAILKEISLRSLPEVLGQKLKINSAEARKIAEDIAILQLSPIKDSLPELRTLVESLGGSLPRNENAENRNESEKTKMPEREKESMLPQKPLREAVEKNRSILDQLITLNPLKLDDSENLVRPTLRNWLKDYIAKKGSGRHSSLQRNEFLFGSENGRKLEMPERTLLSKILESYDEPSVRLPLSDEKGLLAVEKMLKEAGQNAKTFESQGSPVPEKNNPENPLIQRSRTIPDQYREPVVQEKKPTAIEPPRPAPKVSGHVIDLKEFRE